MGCTDSKPEERKANKPARKYGNATPEQNEKPKERPWSMPRTKSNEAINLGSPKPHEHTPVTEFMREQSAKKIQGMLRRRSSSHTHNEEREWKIFNDIDIQDEAQMLMLANFMQSLLDMNYSDKASEMAGLEVDLATPPAVTPKLENCLSIDSVDLDFSSNKRMSGKNMSDYMIPKGAITPATAKDVIDLYRLNGKLSPLSVQTILRQAYKFLKQEQNINRTVVSGDEKVAIIGDLHGQVKDLLYILDENGLPSEENKYVFNGDFVDRGTSGVEVLLLLLCLYCAFPGCVALNRGNHEDYPVCCVYGFQAECNSKYEEKFFGMFCELFNHLPICTIINDAVLVIHGGLFHDPDVMLEDIAEIDRTDYKVSLAAEGEFGIDHDAPRQDYLQCLFREALWSDPHEIDDLLPNSRGSGVLFGPSHTKTFLDNNELSMIVRSHECVPKGIGFPFRGLDMGLLCTVFSASNYGGCGNRAAYLILTTHDMSKSKPIRRSNLHYSVQSFTTSNVKESSLEEKNRMTLKEMVCRKRKALKLTFDSKDVKQTGLVSFTEWAKQMAEVTGLKILWIPLIKTIVPSSCVEGAYIKYDQFLDSLLEQQESSEQLTDISTMYGPAEQLELIFKVFDKNGDGIISRAEFKMGCDHLNSTLPEDKQFKDIDQLLKLLDLDGDDNIDKNELFEVFRHLDGKDGVVDGIISMASKYSLCSDDGKK